MKLKTLIKNKRLLWALLVFIVLLATSFIVFSGNGNEQQVVVVRGSIRQAATLVGKTEARENVELSFDRSGRISSVGAKVGDRVDAGQILATLESGDLYAELDQARATVKAEEARLDKLRRGGREEDIRISEAQLREAENSVHNAQLSMLENLRKAYTNSENAIHNETDQLFDEPIENPSLILKQAPIKQIITVRTFRFRAEKDLKSWSESMPLDIKDDLDRSQYEATVFLENFRQYFDALSLLVNSYDPDIYASATELSAYRSDIAEARLTINASIASLLTQSAELQNAEDNLVVAASQLNLKKAPATVQEIEIQEAAVEQAAGRINEIRSSIRKNTIVSPFSGVVTRQEAKVGETASAGVNIVTIMSEGGYEISAYAPEIDIGKMAVGNDVKITLDAFPGDSWSGKLIYIEPAETIVDGVVNYKIRVAITEDDVRMRGGLTANLSVLTIEKNNTLIVPGSAIVENEEGTFVQQRTEGDVVLIPVVVGIRSDDGNVEIISGLSEGEKILLDPGA